MGGTRCVFFISLLCLCLQHCSSKRVTGQCTLSGRYNDAKQLIRNHINNPTITDVHFPCRYRMLNVRCNGVNTEVFADNSYDTIEYLPYVNGVFVNITTVNDDGSVTYQQLFLNNIKLKAYQDAGNYSQSPWQWTFSGSPLDAGKKIEGSYDQTARRGTLTSGGVTVTLFHVAEDTFRRGVREHTLTITLKCDEETLEALDGGYPKSLCGTPNNTVQDLYDTHREVKLDLHHRRFHYTDYLLVAKQNARQPDPVCQEAADLGGNCTDLGEKMYACRDMYDARRVCLREHDKNPFKLYVTCLRVLCDSDRARSNATCNTLREVTEACGPYNGHASISDMQSRAGCPLSATPAPQSTTLPWWFRGGPSGVCRDKEGTFYRSYTGDQKRTRNSVEPFFQREVPMELPCRYKMANIRCGDEKTQIVIDRDISVDGYSYVSGVIVKVKAKNSKGQTVVQTNKITNAKFKEFLEAGDWTKRLWRWTYSGSRKPRGTERIRGGYNQTSQTAVLRSGQLTVTYAYVNPLNASRPGGTVLTIRCDDPKFKSVDSFPDSLCGRPDDHPFNSLNSLKKNIPHDPHHYDFGKDSVILARQGLKQPNKLCAEAAGIVKSGSCQKLGDQLYSCHQLFNIGSSWSGEGTYFKCLADNQLDTMKVFMSCLRVLCRTEAVSSKETCHTLQQVYKACGDLSPDTPHDKMSKLLALSGCPNATTV